MALNAIFDVPGAHKTPVHRPNFAKNTPFFDHILGVISPPRNVHVRSPPIPMITTVSIFTATLSYDNHPTFETWIIQPAGTFKIFPDKFYRVLLEPYKQLHELNSFSMSRK